MACHKMKVIKKYGMPSKKVIGILDAFATFKIKNNSS